MNDILKFVGCATLGVVVGLLLAGTFQQDGAGGVYNNVAQDFSEGITVDGTVIVDGSGNVDGPLTPSSYIPPVYAPGGDETLTAARSGSIIAMNTAGQDMTLPPASESVGVNYRFVVTAAVGTTNMTIVADPADTFEGSLMVAGAVVTCDAGDTLTFVIDGENIGDYVDVYSDGTSWLVGDSGVLTASKLTCSG